MCAGGGDALETLRGGRARRRWRQGRRQFDVGRKIVGIRDRDGVFARGREHLELLGGGAADRPGVGLYSTKIQPHAPEHARIGLAHHRVALGQRALIGMEGVGVLHDELARTHHAEARPHLVAELELDLVEVDRQLAVTLDVAPCDIGDHLLVRGPEHKVALMAILQAQQLRAVLAPTARLLPQFGGLDRWHQQLQGSGPVHLLAHDGLDLAQRAQAERQPAVDTGRDAPDHPGAQHQLVADDLSLGRGFLDRIDRVLR